MAERVTRAVTYPEDQERSSQHLPSSKPGLHQNISETIAEIPYHELSVSSQQLSASTILSVAVEAPDWLGYQYDQASFDVIRGGPSADGQLPSEIIQSFHAPSRQTGLSEATPAAVRRPSNNSPHSKADETSNEDDDGDFLNSDHEETGDDETSVTSATDLRSQKRRMKRFRLTHSQTRYLMSEFARQAHPDAAHRERLSREIPGLSPRQVQVWFQNRRAKLKRFTNDDRDCMMSSRALPANFDMSQALRQPLSNAPTSTTSNAIAPRGTQSPLLDPSGRHTAAFDTAGRAYFSENAPQRPFQNNYTEITPIVHGFSFASPQSSIGNMSPASSSDYHMDENQRHMLWNSSPSDHSVFNAPSGAVLRAPVQEHLSRPVEEMAGSPLRQTMSYSGLSSIDSHPGAKPQIPPAALSENSQARAARMPMIRRATADSHTENVHYGLGFTYPQLPGYNPSMVDHHVGQQYGFGENEAPVAASTNRAYAAYHGNMYEDAAGAQARRHAALEGHMPVQPYDAFSAQQPHEVVRQHDQVESRTDTAGYSSRDVSYHR